MTTLDVSPEKNFGDGLRYGPERIDTLVWTAVFGADGEKAGARREIRREAASRGILPASILPVAQPRAPRRSPW